MSNLHPTIAAALSPFMPPACRPVSETFIVRVSFDVRASGGKLVRHYESHMVRASTHEDAVALIEPEYQQMLVNTIVASPYRAMGAQ